MPSVMSILVYNESMSMVNKIVYSGKAILLILATKSYVSHVLQDSDNNRFIQQCGMFHCCSPRQLVSPEESYTAYSICLALYEFLEAGKIVWLLVLKIPSGKFFC